MEHSPVMKRRQFLQAATLAAGATALTLSPAATIAAPLLHSGSRGLKALRLDLKGRLVLPGEQGFALAAWPNNARWADVVPLAVAMCATDGDVQKCMQWVREHNVPFAVRSGGHSYAGFSTTTGLLIDVKAMNAVQFDQNTGIATVQAGASNQDIANAMNSTSFAIPSGRCPTVGTAGLVLGGGWGFSASRFGLTCDALRSTDIVTASARKLVVSEDSDKDLFWALRGGGGGNFGVNTTFTFDTHKVDNVTIFNITWPPGRQVELLMALQKIQRGNPRTISTRTKALPMRAGAYPKRSELVVQTLGMYWGTAEQLREVMAPAFSIQAPSQSDIRVMSYWQARDYMVTDDPTGLYDMFSRYIDTGLGETALETMLHWMTRWPGGSVLQTNMGILFAVGGAVKDKAPDATAYVHRNADFIFEMETSWAPIDGPEVVRRQQEWLGKYFEAMQPYLLARSYVNFPSRQLKDWQKAYYGSNLARLSQVKRAYDPQNIFRFAQSIPL